MKLDGLSWRIDAESAGITALVIGDTFAMVSAFNPSIFTMRAFRTTGTREAENSKTDLKIGLSAAAVVSLVVGAGGSLVTRSYWPVAGVVAALAVQGALTKWAVENPHNIRTSIQG